MPSSDHGTVMTMIDGYVAPGFEAVTQVFAGNFARYGDVGAACSVYRRGHKVVDLWGGIADPDSAAPWRQDTLQLVFSCAKGVTTTCILQLVEQGRLDLDAPIANYWPEFAANGKSAITTRMVMSHRAGLAAVEGDLSLQQVLDWDPVVRAIAAQAPNWKPGAGHGYHARSFGWILGELARRISGVSLGNLLRRQVAEPLALDLWIGLPPAQLKRCARLIPPPGGGGGLADMLGPASLTARAMSGPTNLFRYDDMWNQPPILLAEIPSSNLVTDARSLARFYAALIGEVDGIRLLLPQTIEQACVVHSSGPDKVLLRDTTFGLGFSLPPFLGPGGGARRFGHLGAGGAGGFADPDAGIAFAYVMNQMRFDPAGDARLAGLVQAVYQSL